MSYYAFPFGSNGDVPLTCDADGDGRADAGIFRPSTTMWYANGSTNGTMIQQFGAVGDMPLLNAFVR
ncbi:MAG: hypothetical protein KA447_14650 [Pyrinomonadaceae bacterium]|nr:hypothetical protein [Pyrinomonadaceae bacterium]